MGGRRRTAVPREARELALHSRDGVPLSGVVLPGDPEVPALVVAHGFSGSWRHDRVLAILQRLAAHGAVVAVDQRGHGRSGGRTTIGHREPLDVDAATTWAREAGYPAVATIGFSMGAAVSLRHAALVPRPQARGALGAFGVGGVGGTDAVVAVSGPAFWHYRGTPPMRWLHRAVAGPAGRAYVHRVMGTRVDPRPWPADPAPLTPTAAVARAVADGVPVLVVHGDADPFFPLDHPRALGKSGAQVWIEPGFGHAEGAITPELVDRIGAWARSAAAEVAAG